MFLKKIFSSLKFQERNIESEEKNLIRSLVAMEDLPDEIWLKIMEYLPISDILRTMAPVSKKFYRLSRDKNLIKQVEFKSIMNTVKWQSFWREERKKE